MEDDVEEMKQLRENHDQKPKESTLSTNTSAPRKDGGPVTSKEEGTKKKARTFDVMAMFEQAKMTAIERSQANLSISDSVISPSSYEPIKPQKSSSSSSSSDSSSGSDSSDSSDSDSDTDKIKNKRSVKQRDNIGPPITLKNKNEESDIIGPPLPPRIEVKHAEEENMIGPPLPVLSEAADQIDSDEEEEEEEMRPEHKIPSSHEISFNHGSKTLSALGLDPSGARLVTGGYDYDVKFWDFAGMDSSLQSFRNIRPCESHPIKQLQYSTTGDVILVIAGNAKAKVIDRDGFEKLECMKGDPYIVDMANTKGHTAMLNGGGWSPKIREEFMTCSNDGTVRLWDLNSEGKKHKNVLKPRSKQGRGTIPTACTYSNDGRWVAAACQDGSIQIWDHSKSFVNIAMTNRTAHMDGSDTSCLCFSYDGRTLASRGGDDTVKLWDIRNFKNSLVSRDGLTNYFPVTDVLFSPDDQLVVTGISVKKNQGKGKLLFLDRQTLGTITEMEISDTSVVRCIWHPKLNQIVVGSGDGQARLYYDPKKSHRGALLCASKAQKKAREVQVMASQQIITPYALPMFKQGKPTSTRKYEEKVRKDPLKSKRPDLPITGPGEGGRVAEKGATLSQYVVQQLVKRKPDRYENDPRGAILRHAKEAEENPFWVDPAYKKTQPTKIFQEPEEEKEDSDDEPLWKKPKIG